MRNYFQDLCVTPSTPPEQLRAAWVAVRKQLHGDRTGEWDSDAERIANVAYQVLKDPEQRAKHIKDLKFLCDPCTACKGEGQCSTTITFTITRMDRCAHCGGAGYFPRK